jgi:hypothetical protein
MTGQRLIGETRIRVFPETTVTLGAVLAFMTRIAQGKE